uniref:Uncharacterized protein n=1 Tax=Physcomitrium patens TaxID=3218 RepID=A0A2K1JQL4_PHYPA|nr:hypothetical protein PHYPA_016212 [Physcomitrium patens]
MTSNKPAGESERKFTRKNKAPCENKKQQRTSPQLKRVLSTKTQGSMTCNHDRLKTEYGVKQGRSQESRIGRVSAPYQRSTRDMKSLYKYKKCRPNSQVLNSSRASSAPKPPSKKTQTST